MMYHSNVLYEGWKVTPHITQDDETNVEFGKGEVGYNVGITTVKSLPSLSVYTHRSVEFRVRKFLRILDGDSHIIVQLITGNCVSVKRIVGYEFRSPNHKASMYYLTEVTP